MVEKCLEIVRPQSLQCSNTLYCHIHTALSERPSDLLSIPQSQFLENTKGNFRLYIGKLFVVKSRKVVYNHNLDLLFIIHPIPLLIFYGCDLISSASHNSIQMEEFVFWSPCFSYSILNFRYQSYSSCSKFTSSSRLNFDSNLIGSLLL